MLKRTMTYTDYNGNPRTEDFYFNLSKAELTELEYSYAGGFIEAMERLIKAQDAKQIIQIMKDIILKAYGQKSPDGKRFIKTQEIRDEFIQTEAYSDLFMELSTDDVAAATFMKGILPETLSNNSSIPAPVTH